MRRLVISGEVVVLKVEDLNFLNQMISTAANGQLGELGYTPSELEKLREIFRREDTILWRKLAIDESNFGSSEMLKDHIVNHAKDKVKVELADAIMERIELKEEWVEA